jgi:hypothetical protein
MNVAGDFKTESSSSYAFTPAQQAMLAKARNNSRIIFENIKVRLPDGTTRNLGTVALKVKG